MSDNQQAQPPGLLAHKQPQLLPTKTAINGCDAQGTAFYDKDKRKPPTPPARKWTLESEMSMDGVVVRYITTQEPSHSPAVQHYSHFLVRKHSVTRTSKPNATTSLTGVPTAQGTLKHNNTTVGTNFL